MDNRNDRKAHVWTTVREQYHSIRADVAKTTMFTPTPNHHSNLWLYMTETSIGCNDYVRVGVVVVVM